jgi:hypothetical protein
MVLDPHHGKNFPIRTDATIVIVLGHPVIMDPQDHLIEDLQDLVITDLQDRRLMVLLDRLMALLDRLMALLDRLMALLDRLMALLNLALQCRFQKHRWTTTLLTSTPHLDTGAALLEVTTVNL